MLAEFQQFKEETLKRLDIKRENDTADTPTDWSSYRIECSETDLSGVIASLQDMVGEPLVRRDKLETQHGRIGFLQSKPHMTFKEGQKAVKQEKTRLTEFNEQLKAAIEYLTFAPGLPVGLILRSYRSSLSERRFVRLGHVLEMLDGKCRYIREDIEESPYLRADTRSEKHKELAPLETALNILYTFNSAAYDLQQSENA